MCPSVTLSLLGELKDSICKMGMVLGRLERPHNLRSKIYYLQLINFLTH